MWKENFLEAFFSFYLYVVLEINSGHRGHPASPLPPGTISLAPWVVVFKRKI